MTKPRGHELCPDERICVGFGHPCNEPLYPPCECEYGRLRVRFEKRIVSGEMRLIALEPFPERLCFQREFLEQAAPEYVQMGDGIITITLDNGCASYGIIGENLLLNTVCGVKSADVA